MDAMISIILSPLQRWLYLTGKKAHQAWEIWMIEGLQVKHKHCVQAKASIRAEWVLYSPFTITTHKAGHQGRVYSHEMHVGIRYTLLLAQSVPGDCSWDESTFCGGKVGRQGLSLVDLSTRYPPGCGCTRSSKVPLTSKYKPDLFSQVSPLPPLQHKQSF